MTPLHTIEEFEYAGNHDQLKLLCEQCSEPFLKTKLQIKRFLNPTIKDTGCFCSLKCSGLGIVKRKGWNRKEVTCKHCGVSFLKRNSQIDQSRNDFCSRSCSTSYHNKNKKIGIRRSKLEFYLEDKISKTFPKLLVQYNKKDAINSELDIYIPSLNLAFELNGIFHYEPIFGSEKLSSIQNNDERKYQACLERGIELCIINTSKQNNINAKTCPKYWEILLTIIQSKI